MRKTVLGKSCLMIRWSCRRERIFGRARHAFSGINTYNFLHPVSILDLNELTPVVHSSPGYPSKGARTKEEVH